MITIQHLDRKVQTGVSEVRETMLGWGFRISAEIPGNQPANPMDTCILTVAGGQSAACLQTFVEVGRDRSAMNGDVRGQPALPTS